MFLVLWAALPEYILATDGDAVADAAIFGAAAAGIVEVDTVVVADVVVVGFSVVCMCPKS